MFAINPSIMQKDLIYSSEKKQQRCSEKRIYENKIIVSELMFRLNRELLTT